MIKLTDEELATVRAILARHIPGIEVWAFGSRVHGRRLRKFSDLDLAVISEEPLDAGTLSDLKEALSESDLPMMVDIVDWATTDEAFRNIIAAGHEVIQQGGRDSAA